MDSKINKFIATFLLFIQVAILVPAQEINADIRAGKIRLDQYLNRADRERNAIQWERLAEEGLLAAMGEWESQNTYLKENNYASWQQQKAKASIQFAVEKEKKYIGWLSDKYFEEKTQLDSIGLMREIHAKGRTWNYVNSAGEETRIVRHPEISDAMQQWSVESDRLVKEYIDSWDEGQGNVYSEISARIKSSTLNSEEAAVIINGSSKKYRAYILGEYERVSAAETNILMGELLYDHSSLKKKNATEAAGVLAREAVNQAKKETGVALDRVFAEFDTLLEVTEEGDIEIAQKGWLEKFRKTFEESLSKWEEAELSFLSSRADWEKQATQIYLESEQVWAQAYTQMRERRREWESQILAKFSSGLEKWKESGDELNKQIAAAKAELENKVVEERNKSEKMILVQISIYNQSRQMLETAASGINNWNDRWGEKYRGVYAYWKTETGKGSKNDEEASAKLDALFSEGMLEGVTRDGGKTLNLDYRSDVESLLAGGRAHLEKQIQQWKNAYLEQNIHQLTQKKDEYTNKKSQHINQIIKLQDEQKTLTNFYNAGIDDDDNNTISYAEYNKQNKELKEQIRQAQESRDQYDTLISACNRSISALQGKNNGSTSAEISKIISDINTILEKEKLADFDEDLWNSSEDLLDTESGWFSYIQTYKKQADGAVTNLLRLTGSTVAAGSRHIDELESELLKAKAVASYWKDEFSVAKEVNEYAQKVSSDVQAAEETRAALEEAVKSYEQKVSDYQDALEQIEKAGTELDNKEDAASAAQSELNKKKGAVEEARKAYAAAVLALKSIDSDAIRQKAAGLILQIQQGWQNTSEEDENGKSAASDAMVNYYEASLAYAVAVRNNQVLDQQQSLIEGTESEASVSELNALSSKASKLASSVATVDRTELSKLLLEVKRLYPQEEALVSSWLKELDNSAGSAAEKAAAVRIIRIALENLSVGLKNEAEKRMSAVDYIKSGTPPGGASTPPTDKERRFTEIRNWLSAQIAGLEFWKKENPAEFGKADLENLLTLLKEVKETSGEDEFDKKLAEERDQNPTFAAILKKQNVYGNESLFTIIQLEHTALYQSTLMKVDTNEEVKSTYALYEVAALNAKHSAAFIKVSAAIEGKDPDAFSTTTELYAFFEELRSAADGMHSTGREALESYISGVLAKRAARVVYGQISGMPSDLEEQIESLAQNYTEENDLLSEYDTWKNSLYKLADSLKILESENYAKLDEKTREQISGYVAILLMSDLNASDIRENKTADTLIKAISGRLSAKKGITEKDLENVWEHRFATLSQTDQTLLADKVILLYHFNEGEYQKNKVYIEWLSDQLAYDMNPEEGAHEIKVGTHLQNAQIKVYYEAEAFLGAYSGFLANYNGIDRVSTPAQLCLAAAGKDFTNLLDLYNEKNAPPFTFYDRFGELCEANEKAGTKRSEREVLEQIAAELADALGIKADKLPDSYLSKDFDSEFKKKRDEWVTDSRKTLTSEFEESLSEQEKTWYAQAKSETEENLSSSWYSYYLAGEDILYMYLLSDLGYMSIPKAAFFIQDADKKNTAESHYRMNEAVNDYSALVDGDASAWLNDWSQKTGNKLSEQEKERVVDALQNGTPIETVYGYKRMQEQLVGPLGAGYITANMVYVKRHDASTALQKVYESHKKTVENTGYELQFLSGVKAEKAGDRLSWIKQAVDGKVGEVAGLGNEAKAELATILTDSGTAAAAYIGRLEKQIGHHAQWFKNEANKTAYSTNPTERVEQSAYQETLMKRSFEYQRLTNSDALEGDIQYQLKVLKLMGGEEGVKNKEIANQKKRVDSAQAVQDEAEKIWSGKTEELIAEYGLYNQKVEDAETVYKELNQARLTQRAAQEKYDWATSIYLGDMGTNTSATYATPKEKMDEAQYAKERAEISEAVLKSIKDGTAATVDGEYERKMASYEASCRTYYTTLVIAFETGEALAKQEAIVRAAEQEEKIAQSGLVTGYTPKLKDKDKAITEQIPQSELIRINRGEVTDPVSGKKSYTYSIELAYKAEYTRSEIGYREPDPVTVKTAASDLDTKMLEEYLQSENESKTVVGASIAYTTAEKDALEWVKYIQSRGKDYCNNVMLASLYLKTYSEKKGEWLKDETDPANNDDFTMGDIPLDKKFHGIDLKDEYAKARKTVLREAYEAVMNEGGSGDIAKYILYRETNLGFSTTDREKGELEQRAFEKVANTVASEEKTAQIAGVVFLAMALPLFFWLWTIPAALVFTVLAVFNGDKATSFRALKNDINNLKKTRSTNLGEKVQEQENTFAVWTKKKEKLDAEWHVLNTMYYGTATKPPAEKKLNYDTFKTGVERTLVNAASKISEADRKELYTKENFEKSGASEKKTIQEAVKQLSDYMEKQKREKEAELNTVINNLQRKQAIAAEQFYSAQEKAEKISESEKAKLKPLALGTADTTLSVEERKKKQKEYEDAVKALIEETASFKALQTERAKAAWGNNSWNSKTHHVRMIKLQESLYNTQTNYNKGIESFTENTQNTYRDAVIMAYEQSTQKEMEAREHEWNIQVKDFIKQKAAWEDQIRDILSIASQEWGKAEEKINGGYNSWKKTFEAQYEEKQTEWEGNYGKFLSEKNTWIDSQYLYAVNMGNSAAIEQSGGNVEELISKTLKETLIQGQLEKKEMNTQEYVEKLLGETNLRKIMNYAESLEKRGKNAGGTIKRGEKRNSTGIAEYKAAQQVLESVRVDMEKGAAKLAAEQAAKLLEQTKKQYMNRVDGENASMKNWQEVMVRDSGYETGSEIVRHAVIDATLFIPRRERQTVHKYRYFETASPQTSVSLEKNSIEGLDAAGIMFMVDQANKELEHWGERIFGKNEADGSTKQWRIPRTAGDSENKSEYAKAEEENKNEIKDLKELEEKSRKDYDQMSEEDKRQLGEISEKYISVRDGELGEHIGYAPQFKREGGDPKKSLEENVEKKGRGEMGSIMLDFQWNSMRAKNGYAELAKPGYEKRMWDDTGSAFKAPTMRGVLDIAMSMVAEVAGKIIPGSGAIINLLDDLLFAGLDLGGGYKSAAEVGNTLAKKAIGAALSIAMGKAGDALGNLVGGAGKVLKATVESSVNTLGGLVIENANFDKMFAGDWANAYNVQGLTNGLTSASTWGSIASSMVTAGVQGGLESKAGVVGNKFYEGAISMASGFAGQATNYAVHAGFSVAQNGLNANSFKSAYDNMGGISLNILNVGALLDMVGSGIARNNTSGQNKLGKLAQTLGKSGLLEVNIGSKGITSQIGSGGIDVGGALYSLGKRLNDKENLEKYRAKDAKAGKTAYDAYVFGDWTQENTAARLASGKDDLVFSDGSGKKEGWTAQTTQNGKGGRTIEMLDTGNADNNVIQLGHEAYRDGYKPGDIDENGNLVTLESNKAENREAAKAHTEMALRMLEDGQKLGYNANLANDINNYFKGMDAFNSYVDDNYDSSKDYWKALGDGRFIAEKGDTLWALQQETGKDWQESDFARIDKDPTKLQIDEVVDMGKPDSQYSGEVIIASNKEAIKNYKEGDGEAVWLADSVLEAVKNSEVQQNKINERFKTGATTLMQGDYGINFASRNWFLGKNSAFDDNGLFFIGKTTLDYQIYAGTKTTIVDFTAFSRDGFWDLPLTKGVADGIGSGKEWKNSTPYPFLPRTWSISFPNPEKMNWK